MTRLAPWLIAASLSLTCALPVVAQPPGNDLTGGGASSSAPSGPDPGLFMPADPHLSLGDQMLTMQLMGPQTDLGSLDFRQVAAIENALLHPALKPDRMQLIKQSLDQRF